MAARSALEEMDEKGEFKRKDSTYRDFVKKGSKFEPAGMYVCAVCCSKPHVGVMTSRHARHIALPHRMSEGALQVFICCALCGVLRGACSIAVASALPGS